MQTTGRRIVGFRRDHHAATTTSTRRRGVVTGWWDGLPDADQGILLAVAFLLTLLAPAGAAALASML